MAEDTTDYQQKTITQQAIEIVLPKMIPDVFLSNIFTIKDDCERIARGEDKGIINESGSIRLSQDGSISLSSGKLGTVKISSDGLTELINTDTTVTTNALHIKSDDIVINNHKLNNKLYELADFKNVLSKIDETPKIVGGLTMLGTVLAKVWEPNLKRYVLVRRQINIPVFSPELGGTIVNPGAKLIQNTSFLEKIKNEVNLTNLDSSTDLFANLKAARDKSIAATEASLVKEKEALIAKNNATPAVSSTKITGQDPGTVQASKIAAAAQQSQSAKVDQAAASKQGWDATNDRPADTEAIWYKVKISAHKFYVMQGQTIKETWDCNTAAIKGAKQKNGDNKTPYGIYKIGSPEESANDSRTDGCKLPGQAGVFGPWFTSVLTVSGVSSMDIDSCGIGIHGDYASEDANSSVLTTDAKGENAVAGEGSTHGCIRLHNKNDIEFATKYAKAGQFIEIGD